MRYAARAVGYSAGAPLWFPREAIQDDALFAALRRVHDHPTAPATAADLLAALGGLVRRHAITRPEATFVRAATRAALFNAAAYACHHAAEPLRVEELAARYRLRPTGFIRAFTGDGAAALAYALLCRVSHAKALLTAGHPLVDVALEAGFYDQSHFTNYFKRYVGVTPVAYRAAVRVV